MSLMSNSVVTPKKLPYNSDENPLVVAEKFCARESLSKSNCEQICQFIRQNVRGRAGYGPGLKKEGQAGGKAKELTSNIFPYNQIIIHETGNFDGLSKKLFEFDEAMKDTPLALKETEQTRLQRILAILKDTGNYHTYEISELEIEVITTKLLKWPLDKLLPVLDLFRLFLLHPRSEKLFSGLDSGLGYLTLLCQVVRSTQSDVLITLVLKVLANMFYHICNKNSVMKYADMILEALESQQVNQRPKDTLRTALAAFVFNVSTAITNLTNDIVLEKLFSFINNTLPSEGNPENVMRYLIAYGNTLSKCASATDAAQNMGIKNIIEQVQTQNPQAEECKNDLLKYLA